MSCQRYKFTCYYFNRFTIISFSPFYTQFLEKCIHIALLRACFSVCHLLLTADSSSVVCFNVLKVFIQKEKTLFKNISRTQSKKIYSHFTFSKYHLWNNCRRYNPLSLTHLQSVLFCALEIRLIQVPAKFLACLTVLSSKVELFYIYFHIVYFQYEKKSLFLTHYTREVT